MSTCYGAAMVKSNTITEKKNIELRERQRRRKAVSKDTDSPTVAPVTSSPTREPTVTPTATPTVFPTAYPTQKKSMERAPQVVTPTFSPVVATLPVTNAPLSNIGGTNAPALTLPSSSFPIAFTTPPVTFAPSTIAPSTLEPSTLIPTTLTPVFTPSVAPSVKPSAVPSNKPSGSPIVSTNTPTGTPTLQPTYSNLTSQLALSDFSVLLLSLAPVVNVGQVEATLETYMKKSMMLENLVSVSLTPITASSAQGSNFTSTSIRFAGTASFVIELPTQSTLSMTQDGVILASSFASLQEAIANNANLAGVRVVDVSYNALDPKSIIDTSNGNVDEPINDTPPVTEDNIQSSNAGLIAGLVLAFSVVIVGGALYAIRRRRLANAQGSNNASTNVKPASSRKMEIFPALGSHYPDIEKPKEESINTPNDDDDESESAADLSSYMMSPTGSIVTELRGTTTSSRDKDFTIIRPTTFTTNAMSNDERPTVEISVSHIEDVDDDIDYTSTDDGSAKFGATDMSECTFK
jgi:hypothetical protein